MDANKTLEKIMREITAGLTGEWNEDKVYLQEQMDKYKEHELSTEIIRACGRLLSEVMPDEVREKFNQVFANEQKGTSAELDEIRFNIYKKDYEKAQRLMENLVKEGI